MLQSPVLSQPADGEFASAGKVFADCPVTAASPAAGSLEKWLPVVQSWGKGALGIWPRGTGHWQSLAGAVIPGDLVAGAVVTRGTVAKSAVAGATVAGTVVSGNPIAALFFDSGAARWTDSSRRANVGPVKIRLCLGRLEVSLSMRHLPHLAPLLVKWPPAEQANLEMR
jgi:hypothetical protein